MKVLTHKSKKFIIPKKDCILNIILLKLVKSTDKEKLPNRADISPTEETMTLFQKIVKIESHRMIY